MGRPAPEQHVSSALIETSLDDVKFSCDAHAFSWDGLHVAALDRVHPLEMEWIWMTYPHWNVG